MTTLTGEMQLEAQQILDELFAEDLISFTLSARTVESIGLDEYIVRFHDNRVRSLDVSWRPGQTFKAVFRTAILNRVGRLGVSQRLARNFPLHHPRTFAA